VKVVEAPHDLVVLVACADLERLVEQLLERGEESGCLRETRFRMIRDPMRDQVCNAPERLLAPFLRESQCRFLILWDHQGSGHEAQLPTAVEDDVLDRMVRTGVERDRVAAIAISPELEGVLRPVWLSAQTILATVRKRRLPHDADLLTQLRRMGHEFESATAALNAAPKETLQALIACLGLRWSPALFATLGRELPVPTLKGAAPVSRVASRLESWFGAGR
jgi:hypothetical protein